jgi:hypothetical protein
MKSSLKIQKISIPEVLIFYQEPCVCPLPVMLISEGKFLCKIYITGCTTARWMLAVGSRVQFQVTLCEICEGLNFSQRFFNSLLLFIPPLFHNHPSLPSEEYDGHKHEAHYHILSLQGRGFSSGTCLVLSSKRFFMGLKFYTLIHKQPGTFQANLTLCKSSIPRS